jgi:exopolysaccharide biosynthesis operon protein EpsL
MLLFLLTMMPLATDSLNGEILEITPMTCVSSPALIPLPLLAPLTLVICGLFSGGAMAEPGDVFTPYAGVMVSHDDNLFRLSGPEDAQLRLGTSNLSDTYRRLNLGLNIDKQISQQRLTVNLGLNRTAYNRFSQLDSDGKDLQVNLNWHLGTHVQGNLGATYIEALTPFSNFRATTERNLRTQKRTFADGAWRFHPSWQVRGSVAYDQLNYALSTQRGFNRELNTEVFGIDYLSATKSSVGVQAGHSSATYVSFLNNYSQNEFKGKIDWYATGKSRLQFLGGWVERKHDLAPERDYSGTNARVVATHQLTGQVGLTANLYREIGSLDDLINSYSLNNGVSLEAAWEISSKTRLAAQLLNERRSFALNPTLANQQTSDRQDTYRRMSLIGNYLPTRKWSIIMIAYRDQQSSNQTFGNYHATGLSLNTRYDF